MIFYFMLYHNIKEKAKNGDQMKLYYIRYVITYYYTLLVISIIHIVLVFHLAA